MAGVGAGAGAGLDLAASASPLVMRPSLPVGVTCEASMLLSANILRTAGDVFASLDGAAVASFAGAGAAAAGLVSSFGASSFSSALSAAISGVRNGRIKRGGRIKRKGVKRVPFFVDHDSDDEKEVRVHCLVCVKYNIILDV